MGIIDKITETVVKVPLVSTTKPELLKELLQVLVDAGGVKDQAAAYTALLDREGLGTTGLQDGIAIPHAKTAAVDRLEIAIGIAPAGVEFQALDSKPSKVFFMILAAPDQSGLHIEALSEIAGISRSSAFIQALSKASSATEVIRLIHE